MSTHPHPPPPRAPFCSKRPSSFSTWSEGAPTIDDILELHDTVVNEDGTVVILGEDVDLESEQKEHILASHVFHWNNCMNHFQMWKGYAKRCKVGLSGGVRRERK